MCFELAAGWTSQREGLAEERDWEDQYTGIVIEIMAWMRLLSDKINMWEDKGIKPERIP